jgi:hypothetical protein
MTTIRSLSDAELDFIQSSWRLDNNDLYWVKGRAKGKKVCSSDRRSGHENVYLRYAGKLRGYVKARIIWFFRTGEYPTLYVEHKDCNPKNNSADNLRLATHSENMANASVGRTGRTKKGVYLDKRVGKYYAQVQKDGIVVSKSGFDTFDEAYIARQQIASKLFGEFAR